MSTFNFSPSSSAKGSSSNPHRRSPWSSLAQPALGVALAMGVLTAGQAQALVVNVAGQAWDVTTFTGMLQRQLEYICPTERARGGSDALVG